MTKAKLIGIDTADWDASLEQYENTGRFSCYFQASIGPDDAQGAEIFGFTACNREWLEGMAEKNHDIPKLVVVSDISLGAVEHAVEIVCRAIPHGSWDEIAHRLAQAFDWEFEGYVPS